MFTQDFRLRTSSTSAFPWTARPSWAQDSGCLLGKTFQVQQSEKGCGVRYSLRQANLKGKPGNASLQKRCCWNISVKKRKFAPWQSLDNRAKPGNLAVSAAGRVGKWLTVGRRGEVGQVRGCPEPHLGDFTLGWRNNLEAGAALPSLCMELDFTRFLWGNHMLTK